MIPSLFSDGLHFQFTADRPPGSYGSYVPGEHGWFRVSYISSGGRDLSGWGYLSPSSLRILANRLNALASEVEHQADKNPSPEAKLAKIREILG